MARTVTGMPPTTDTQPAAAPTADAATQATPRPLSVTLDWTGRVSDAEERGVRFEAFRYRVTERLRPAGDLR